MNRTGIIYGINGPVIYLKGNTGFKMSEMVYVGKEKLVGEVINLTKDTTTIQVFEETTGLKPGEEVVATGDAISVTLAPGILSNIFDGIERPLSEIAKKSGAYISRGVSVDSLDTEKLWKTHMTIEKGQAVFGGTIIAEVPETHAIVHKVMVPPNMEGIILDVCEDGEYTINDPLCTLQLNDGTEVNDFLEDHLNLLKSEHEVNILHFHPGFIDEFIIENTSLILPRAKDLDTLCQPEIKKWIKEHFLITNIEKELSESIRFRKTAECQKI